MFSIFAATSVKAQILGLGVNFEKLNLPEEFFRSLQNCQTYKYELPAEFENIKTKTIYSVVAKQNKICNLHVEGFTNTSVHITQDCDFTFAQAMQYADTLRRYQQKGYSPRWNGDKINADADYQAAYKIMANPDICRFYRDAIDHTENIRQNLLSCKPAEQVENSGDIKILRQIKGTKEKLCEYSFTVLQNFKENININRKTMTFSCLFDQEQSRRYLEILQSLVVEAEEGFDFSAIQRISVAEELNFILSHCNIDALR